MAKKYRAYSSATLRSKYGTTEKKVRTFLKKYKLDGGANVIKIMLMPIFGVQLVKAFADYRLKVKDGIAPAYKFKKGKVGAFAWRVMRNSNSVSKHAYAIAIDFNFYDPNGYSASGKKGKVDYTKEFVKSMNAFGIWCGGDWTKPWDGMHFEYAPNSDFGGAKPYTPKGASKPSTGSNTSITGKTMYLTRNTNFRSSAKVGNNVIGKTRAKGTKVVSLSDKLTTASGYNWRKVKIGDKTGYVIDANLSTKKPK